ncbi:hypothetical protein Agabi119p4_7457 [Agaricus bisporus var. burnettii]|uniref:Bud22 domain-containing protein n=1 Tax=Agaricus bisporus var. burnettii TaxID=192524 RepID=A0A8H7EYY6_AGABI|nr:hypothetical protein Agabi119p4_7457 [Agaricus bisporus var. burnettii]
MEPARRGLKRKRDALEDSTGGDSKIIGKLHHGIKEVKKAAKKAKTFETQRLVKKLKGLRKNETAGSDIAEHEAQLHIIKTVDHEIFANIAIKSKFAKDHLLSRHEAVNEALSQEVGNKVLSIAPLDGTTGKAYSRLLSSKVLAAEISSLCRVLHELLDPEAKKSAETDNHVALDDREVTKNVMSGKRTPSKLISVADSKADSYLDLEKVVQGESGIEDDDLSYISNEELASAEEGDLKYPQIESSEDDEMDDDDDRSIVKKIAPSAAKPSGVESTFLPSLSVGFIRGSDESDWSDGEAQIADPGMKKNRRGQRARRAIWEKKYGRNANHKKKELEALPKYTRRFPEDNRGIRRGQEPRFEKRRDIHGGSKEQTSHSAIPRSEESHQQINKQDERPLHPSWVAKRQMKEKQTLGMVPSQGTKIKFAD